MSDEKHDRAAAAQGVDLWRGQSDLPDLCVWAVGVEVWLLMRTLAESQYIEVFTKAVYFDAICSFLQNYNPSDVLTIVKSCCPGPDLPAALPAVILPPDHGGDF